MHTGERNTGRRGDDRRACSDAQRIARFDDLFVHLNVPLLHDAEIRDLLLDRAKGLDIELSDDALATLMALPVQFQPSLSPPTGALQLLDNVRDYQQEKSRIGEPVPIDASFIERVFAIYSGRPLFLVSPRTKISANDIRAWFQGRLIGQHEAIEAVVNAITLFKSGLNNRAQPILSVSIRWSHRRR